MSTHNVPATGWFTSSFSQGEDINCVEANLAPDAVYVRHSRHPSDAVIRYTHAQWNAFTHGVKADEFDPDSP
ncbi:MAG: DUF397 domain-containing protein [Pseudonocardiaceae bacterium]